jgi:hypothetical protein
LFCLIEFSAPITWYYGSQVSSFLKLDIIAERIQVLQVKRESNCPVRTGMKLKIIFLRCKLGTMEKNDLGKLEIVVP